MSVNFDTGDMILLSANRFNAEFSVPDIVTIGSNFKLIAQVEGGITLRSHSVGGEYSQVERATNFPRY